MIRRFFLLLLPLVLCAAALGPHENGPSDSDGIMIDGAAHNRITFRNPNLGLAWFNSAIRAHRVRGKIVSCDLLIDLPVGVARGNHSYGGDCILRAHGRSARIEICNDVIVGHFKVNSLAGGPVSRDDLAAFVAANCYGG